MFFLKKIQTEIFAVICFLAFVSFSEASLTHSFTSGTDIAVIASSYTASGSLSLSLGFPPLLGTNLTVVNNTGLAFISGTFTGVPQGGLVPLTYNGVTYNYIANYFGGNGRSLVLQWPCLGLDAWGSNSSGELGNSSTTNQLLPTAATTSGVLAGKTLIALTAGASHSLALTSEGKVYAWGDNFWGELGNNTCPPSSLQPVAVDTTGALAGKTVVAIAQGCCNMALTTEGKIYTWGGNGYGQLGISDTNTQQSYVPVAVDTTGDLAGKTVVAIAAGDFFCLALTSEGKVYAWGLNDSLGMLGIGSTDSGCFYSPTLVTGTLTGKTVTAIAAGQCHSLALTSEGTVYSWGWNGCGQLGNSGSADAQAPVAVDMTGVLLGKSVTAIAAGWCHSLALTADGQLYSWGDNTEGELGMSDTNTTQSSSPVAVNTSGVLAGKIISAISAGEHSLAISSDGQLFGWGENAFGELGTSDTINRYAPVLVSNTGDWAGKQLTAITAGRFHSLSLFGSAPPSVTVNPVSQTGTAGAVLVFTAAAPENPSPVIQWQVSSTGSSGTFSNITDNATATTGTLTLPCVTMAQNGSAYRAIFSNNAGNATSTAATLTVVNANTEVAFNSAASIPMTATGTAYASGSLTITLGFAPTPGTNLTLIKNRSTSFISGMYINVPQGGTVPLTYNGVTYNFVANYYGGNGRSLVLQWSCIGLDTWGDNNSGQLGNGSTLASAIPVAVNSTGTLAGKTVFSIVSGDEHNLALTSDGQILAWGNNRYGELGNSGTVNSLVPTLVNTSGVLAGKTVVAIAGGNTYHNLALTSEGTVYSWGFNSSGQLGSYFYQVGSSPQTNSAVPVAVNTNGALAGKTVIAIAAGGSFPNYHSLALTSDGQIVGWGDNSSGVLGADDTGYCLVPVAMNTTGTPLEGKTVVAIAAGGDHTLALTADGQVFAWGDNTYGELGNSSTLSSFVPVPVNTSGVLSGKVVTAIAAGKNHSLALTADGSVYTWGANNSGELGNGITIDSSVPVAVDTTGVLSGKTVIAISAGGVDYFGAQSLALTSDGQVYAWGWNPYGQLGNNSTQNSSVPVAVNVAGDLAGKPITAIASGAFHNLTMVGSEPPTVIQNPVSRTGTPGSTVSFSAMAIGNPSPFSVQWQVSTTGTGGSFSNIIDNATATTGTLVLTNVTADQNAYAYRAVFFNVGGNSLTTPALLTTIIPLNLVATFKSGADTAMTMNSPVFISGSLTVILDFAPTLGTNLTVIKNTTASFINGRFSNVPQGATFSLTYNGLSYDYIANYYGGNARSLVFQSPCMGVADWGFDYYGQLGNNSQTLNPVSAPTAVITNSGVLAGKPVLNIAAGGFFNLALTASGQIYSWGANFSGELGNNSITDSWVPVAVDTTGVLAGKTVTSIAAANGHSLAVTSDGQLVAWGFNSSGQLGNSGTIDSWVPVAVNTSGVLAGKIVTSIAAGANHSMALTSDGLVYTWGYNGIGMLGNNSVVDNSPVPVAVTANGVLFNKTVIAIAAGDNHCLALTSDGFVYSWGYGPNGQLGNNTANYSLIPVPVNSSGILANKTVVAIAAGGSHSLALTSDGLVYAWGSNSSGQLGNSGTTDSLVPVAVNTTGALAGKTVTAISAGDEHSMALTSDGQAVTWGKNNDGQLGNGLTSSSTVPVAVNTSGILAGKTVVAIASGADHNIVLFGSVPPSYSVWQNQFFSSSQLSNPAIAADTADPAGDNIPNLMKYALNLNPASNGAGNLPKISIKLINGGNYLTITYNQVILAGNLLYMPEVSSDLQTWYSGPGYTGLVSLTNNPDGLTQTIVVRDLQPLSANNKRFIRLTVTKP